ncbi:uncharacterized protein LOC143769466 [Ranitomeya variabilis]|uniref:uncharacterized protein LOC143769466 n=1 Tax=Ranitomeya variabilis TaxID=490064 RepID=UPI0040577C68
MSWKPILSPRTSHDSALNMKETVGSQLPSRMSANRSEIVHLLADNRTAAEDPTLQDERNNTLLVYNVLSVTGMAFALVLFILSITICTISYQKRQRRYRRACEYEKTVKCGENRTPIRVTGVKRVLSFHKSFLLLKNRDRSSLHSKVYFIYNNPALSAEEETEEEEEEEVTDRKVSINQITEDIKSTGIILNPRVFYV